MVGYPLPVGSSWRDIRAARSTSWFVKQVIWRVWNSETHGASIRSVRHESFFYTPEHFDEKAGTASETTTVDPSIFASPEACISLDAHFFGDCARCGQHRVHLDHLESPAGGEAAYRPQARFAGAMFSRCIFLASQAISCTWLRPRSRLTSILRSRFFRARHRASCGSAVRISSTKASTAARRLRSPRRRRLTPMSTRLSIRLGFGQAIGTIMVMDGRLLYRPRLSRRWAGEYSSSLILAAAIVANMMMVKHLTRISDFINKHTEMRSSRRFISVIGTSARARFWHQLGHRGSRHAHGEAYGVLRHGVRSLELIQMRWSSNYAKWKL